MGPIAQLMRATLNDDTDKYNKTLDTFNIVLNGEEKQLLGEPLRMRSSQIGCRQTTLWRRVTRETVTHIPFLSSMQFSIVLRCLASNLSEMITTVGPHW